MSNDLTDILNELDKRSKRNQIADTMCFEQQLKFIRDTSKHKAVLAPRRCLARGTMVATERGPVPIEAVEAGDLVYSEHGRTIEVLARHANGRRGCVDVIHGQALIVRCTADHRVQASIDGKLGVYSIGALDNHSIFVCYHKDRGFNYLYPVRNCQVYDAGERETFDLEVDSPSHLFLLENGLVVHNSGKSNAFGIDLLQDALNYPRRTQVYMGLSAAAAHDSIFRDVIRPICDDQKIRHKYNATSHVITFPSNGSTIKLVGLDSSPQDMQRLRGNKFHKAIVDECQSYRQDLRVLINDVVGPALADYTKKGGGQLILGGTPGTHMGTNYWFQITKHTPTGMADPDRARGWSVHEWAVPDNPFMAAEFGEILKQQYEMFGPAYADRPEFKREWLGKWVLDPGLMVYKWDKDRNTLADDELMRSLLNGSDRWSYIIGVDLGWEDATAVTIGAYCDTDPTLYIVHSEKIKHADLNLVGVTLLAMRNRFNAKCIAIDTGGGASKQFAMSIQSQFQMPIKAAQKNEKESAVGRFNADLMSGRIKVVRNGGANQGLINEWERLTLDKFAMDTSGKWKEDEKHENHQADSCLYMYRESLHGLAKVPDLKPAEDHAARMIAMKRRLRPAVDEDPEDAADRERDCREIVRRFRGD